MVQAPGEGSKSSRMDSLWYQSIQEGMVNALENGEELIDVHRLWQRCPLPMSVRWRDSMSQKQDTVTTTVTKTVTTTVTDAPVQ